MNNAWKQWYKIYLVAHYFNLDHNTKSSLTYFYRIVSNFCNSNLTKLFVDILFRHVHMKKERKTTKIFAKRHKSSYFSLFYVKLPEKHYVDCQNVGTTKYYEVTILYEVWGLHFEVLSNGEKWPNFDLACTAGFKKLIIFT